MQKFINQYWSVIIWCLVIFSLSSFPTLPRVGFIWWDFLLKKSAHVFEYAVLFTLYYRSMKNRNYRSAFLFTLAFALSDEYHQSLVMGRTAKITDVGIDSLGMLLAYLKISHS